MRTVLLNASLAFLFASLAPFSVSAWYGGYGGFYEYYYPTYDHYYDYYDPGYGASYYPSSYYYPVQYYYPQPYGYGASTPSPYNYSYQVGDSDTFGYDLCYWEGYGRGRCDFNPRQPVYDHWTGTWY